MVSVIAVILRWWEYSGAGPSQSALMRSNSRLATVPYSALVHHHRRTLRKNSRLCGAHWGSGGFDPAFACPAMLEIVDAENAPLRVAFGMRAAHTLDFRVRCVSRV